MAAEDVKDVLGVDAKLDALDDPSSSEVWQATKGHTSRAIAAAAARRAMDGGGGPGGPIELDDLVDVDLDGSQVGDVLTKIGEGWGAQAPSGGSLSVQADDPGAVGVGNLWSDITGGVNWQQLSPATSPPPRQGTSLAYHEASGKLVMFGGVNTSGSNLDDTWTFDGVTWTEENPDTVPPPRADHQIAYDAVREEVVMFGGTGLGDTWVWDGTDWTEKMPVDSPSPRSDYGCAWDAAREVIILFGGFTSDDSSYDNSDTWTWDGTNWNQESPDHSPPGRACERMFAYDTAREKVVMFGGYGDTGSGDDQLGDTWTWDGADWTEEAPDTSPPLRTYGATAYDTAREKVVMFGGQDIGGGPSLLGDTWTWDGSQWTEETPGTSPSDRYDLAIATHPDSGLTLFGGNTRADSAASGNDDETWHAIPGEPVLKIRNAADDGWTRAAGGSIPAGGSTGEVLTKQSNADGDADWEAPAGGSQPITSPLDIDDCVLWLDASDATTINGGSPSDNDPVTSWVDKSTSGFDATTAEQIQTIDITGASSGQYELGDPSGMGSPTAPIAWNADAATVQTAIRTLPSCAGAVVTEDSQVYTVTTPDVTGGLASGGGFGVTQDTLDVVPSVNVVQASGGPPTWLQTGHNGKGAIQFDPSSFAQALDLLTAGGMLRNKTGASIICVCQDFPVLGAVLYVSTGLDRTVIRLSYQVDGLLSQPDDGGSQVYGTTQALNSDSIVGVVGTCGWSSSGLIVVTGGRIAPNHIGHDDPITASSDTDAILTRIGTNPNNADDPYTGVVCEIAVYDRELNASEARQLAEYASAKWATP